VRDDLIPDIPSPSNELERREISVVVPLFDEEANILELYGRLTAALEKLSSRYEIVFVDDGSSDATPDLLDGMQQSDSRVVVVHLSRNFGHQPAICAGLNAASGRAVILMDGDLQDPPEVLHLFVDAWRKGCDVAYAVREKRKEGLAKRSAYFVFYRLLRAISDLEIPLDSGDFCLMDRKVVDVLNHLPEQTRFVRGLRTFVGFRQVPIRYERAARAAGQPKYSFSALVRLAVDGLVNFSGRPLQVATYFGFVTAFVGLALTAWALSDALYRHTAPRGWASTMVVVLFMGSIQLISLGIIGAYIRRIFIESKGRPAYIVRSVQRNDATSTPVRRAIERVADGDR
jgi:glycosyltransferase involved in cell wall biosynthesis